MCCLSLLIQVTFFVHLIHLLIRANHLICNLGKMYDTFSVPVLYHYIAIRYSLFAIHYSLFAIRYSLFAIRYSLFAIRYSLFTLAVKRCCPPKSLFIYIFWEILV